MNILYFAVAIFFANIPFGYWRQYEKDRKNFKGIMFAIHIPVVFIILARFLLHIKFSLYSLFLNIVFFTLGQLVGALSREDLNKHRKKGI